MKKRASKTLVMAMMMALVFTGCSQHDVSTADDSVVMEEATSEEKSTESTSETKPIVKKVKRTDVDETEKEITTEDTEETEETEEAEPEKVDFSQYVGSYKATDGTNDAFGGGDTLDDLEIHEDGSITGGQDDNSESYIPDRPADSITQGEDGTIVFSYDVGEERTLEFTVYPNGHEIGDKTYEGVCVQFLKAGPAGVYNPFFIAY
ncbi:MAG: hypothetical protein IKS48_13995 [Eubacterium sp.]|nr:hypothetical protein [Eubacterium sp.]